MTEPFEGLEFTMPSALVIEPDASFRARVKRNQARPSQYADTSIFRHNGQNIVMGQEALTNGQRVRMAGAAKYRAGIIDNLIFGALLKAAPEGHDNVFISYGHSANAVSISKDIDDLIGGRHEIERSDGEKVVFRVRNVMGWDEPGGAPLRFAERERDSELLAPGQKIIIVDIGGRVSSVYAAMTLPGEGIQIYWNEGESFEGGIQIISETLETLLRDFHPQFAALSTISPLTLEEALQNIRMVVEADGSQRLHHFAHCKGYEIDVTQAVYNATAPTLNQISTIYDQKLRSGSDARYIVVGGGGGGLLFGDLTDVLAHRYMYKAEEDNCMHLANLRGAVISSNSYAIAHYEKILKVAKDGTVTRPLMFVVDAGNTNTKFRALWL